MKDGQATKAVGGDEDGEGKVEEETPKVELSFTLDPGASLDKYEAIAGAREKERKDRVAEAAAAAAAAAVDGEAGDGGEGEGAGGDEEGGEEGAEGGEVAAGEKEADRREDDDHLEAVG